MNEQREKLLRNMGLLPKGKTLDPFTPDERRGLNALAIGARVSDSRPKDKGDADQGSEIAALKARIAALETLVHKSSDIRSRVFIGSEGGDGTFAEGEISGDGNSLELPAGARVCDDAGHYSKLITLTDLDATGVVILEIPYAGGMRYVAIRGSSGAGFWAQITANSQDGSNKRWTYTFVQVAPTGSGFDSWNTVEDGLSGTAYNTIEDMNDDEGLMGNGVDTDNLGGTFDIQPAPAGAIVRMQITTVDGDPRYDFQYENGVDGECT